MQDSDPKGRWLWLRNPAWYALVFSAIAIAPTVIHWINQISARPDIELRSAAALFNKTDLWVSVVVVNTTSHPIPMVGGDVFAAAIAGRQRSAFILCAHKSASPSTLIPAYGAGILFEQHLQGESPWPNRSRITAQTAAGDSWSTDVTSKWLSLVNRPVRRGRKQQPGQLLGHSRPALERPSDHRHAGDHLPVARRVRTPRGRPTVYVTDL